MGVMKTYRKSQPIFDENSPGDAMYILHRGKITIRLGGEEGVEIATLDKPGDFFGEMALIDGSLRSATAIASEDETTLEVLDRNGFLEMVKETPEFALGVMHALSDRIRMGNERRLAEEKLKETLAELDRSNEELEQFAYVASHDLREPLRMVTSFAQSLDKKYHGKLDETADEYIHFIVDGAARMQRLIDDILQYSRVSTRALPFEKLNAEEVLETVLLNLDMAIKEAHAKVTHDPLPVIYADPSQLGQVLQNLISNAIKFTREGETAAVHISAKRDGDQFVFSVKDSGIGIEPELFEKVFVIFQRLNPADKYPGTGIGLAVTKKIVERHGGQIWVESTPGQGTTFFFTMPAEVKDEKNAG